MARADHVLLGWVNHADAGTVAASAIAGDLAASNLQNDIVGRRWRTTDLGAHVDVDFGGAREIGVLALVFPRDVALPLAASIRHQLDDGDGSAGDGGVHDSGVIALGLADGYGVHLYQPPAPVTARYWRFTFSQVSGVDYVDVGRAWAGPAYQPERNLARGPEVEWVDLSGRERNRRSGARFVDERPRHRRVRFRLPAMTDADREAIEDMTRIAGTSRQVLASLRPTAPNAGRQHVLGRLEVAVPLTQRFHDLHRATDITIEEDL